MKIEKRPWRPQDLIDDLQSIIDEETDNYLNTKRTTLCQARDYLKEYFSLSPNTPLTLEELREMDGMPVFCHSLLTGKEGWTICRIAECEGKWYLTFSGGEQAYGDKDTIGKNWIAFRRKPEEG